MLDKHGMFSWEKGDKQESEETKIAGCQQMQYRGCGAFKHMFYLLDTPIKLRVCYGKSMKIVLLVERIRAINQVNQRKR